CFSIMKETEQSFALLEFAVTAQCADLVAQSELVVVLDYDYGLRREQAAAAQKLQHRLVDVRLIRRIEIDYIESLVAMTELLECGHRIEEQNLGILIDAAMLDIFIYDANRAP